MIWLQPGALARGLRVKFEIDDGALEIPYGRRMEDVVRVHSIEGCRIMSCKVAQLWYYLDILIASAPLGGIVRGMLPQLGSDTTHMKYRPRI